MWFRNRRPLGGILILYSFAGVFFTVKTSHLPLFHRDRSRIEVTHWPLLSSTSSVWVWNCHSNTPALTHISNFTLFHLVFRAVLFLFLASIYLWHFLEGQKSSAKLGALCRPTRKAVDPGEPLTSDDLEIAKKLDPKVPNSMGKWHQQKKRCHLGKETKNTRWWVSRNLFVVVSCYPRTFGGNDTIWGIFFRWVETTNQKHVSRRNRVQSFFVSQSSLQLSLNHYHTKVPV